MPSIPMSRSRDKRPFVRASITLGLAAGLWLAVAGFAAPVTAFAQQSEPARPQIRTLPPAYNDQMLRLAEILGSLHYLRELCGADEGQLWRDQMLNLIDKEEPTEERRAELISRFNRGFRTFREIYRACTPPAVQAVELYLRQGSRLAGEIPNRYGR